MYVEEMAQVLQDILEEYRAIHLKDSPITWIRRLDGAAGSSGLILCVKSEDVFCISIKEVQN